MCQCCIICTARRAIHINARKWTSGKVVILEAGQTMLCDIPSFDSTFYLKFEGHGQTNSIPDLEGNLKQRSVFEWESILFGLHSHLEEIIKLFDCYSIHFYHYIPALKRKHTEVIHASPTYTPYRLDIFYLPSQSWNWIHVAVPILNLISKLVKVMVKEMCPST